MGNLLKGLGRIFDFTGETFSKEDLIKNYSSKSGSQIDKDAMRNDFYNVGSDMRKAMKRVRSEINV
jgi:hypothetical protein